MQTHRTLKPPTIQHATPVYSDHVISGKMAVCAALSSLVETRQVLSVWEKRKDFYFFATLMAFDPAKELIYLERSTEGLSRQINLAEDFVCFAEINHQQVQFTLSGLLQDTFYGTPAWVANLPERIVSLQQREHLRTPIPITKPSFCKIRGINGYACPKEIRVQLVDVSASGIGFVAPAIMCGVFSPNAIFNRCELQIHNQQTVVVNLRVRSSYAVTSKSGIRGVRVGAEITAIARTNSDLMEHMSSLAGTATEPTLSGIWEKPLKPSYA